MIITVGELKRILDEAEEFCKIKSQPLSTFGEGVNQGVHLMGMDVYNRLNNYQRIQDAAKEVNDDNADDNAGKGGVPSGSAE